MKLTFHGFVLSTTWLWKEQHKNLLGDEQENILKCEPILHDLYSMTLIKSNPLYHHSF